MKAYDHKKIEKKWQAVWEKKKIFQAKNGRGKKFYALIEFPYPSGAGLHVGHIRSNTAMDIISRKRRMEGFNVLYPIGWDAFGLPTENYAIKTGIQPAVVTKKNTGIFRKQLKALGFSFDWSREINTTDTKYYKWTQWIFLQFLKKGLAYKAKMKINWCPKDKTGLANEEVINGCCERCGTPVEKREKEQWMLAITKYADRLDKDLDEVDYLPQIKLGQRNWIGKSEGAEIEFKIQCNPSPALPEGEGKKPTRVLVLHGRNGTPDKYVFPWLKQQLEKRGYIVEIPALPNTNEPNDIDQADYVEKNCLINEKTIIVGQSFGGIVAMRLLERGIKVAGVFLVTVPFSGKFNDGKIRKSVTDACKKGFNFKIIKKNASSFVILRDKNDIIVPHQDAELWQQSLDGVLLDGYGKVPHFSGDEEPDMLKSILNNYPSPALPTSPNLPKGEGGFVSPFGGEFKEGVGEGEMPRYFTTNPELWKVLQDKALEMRKNPTEGEKIMWDLLRRNTTEYHFRRQHIIDRFVVDFVCIEKKLILEVDGDIHDYKKAEDQERTKILNQLGFEVVRFSNDEIIKKPKDVLAKIILKINSVSIKALSFGEGLGGVFGEGLGGVKVFTTRPDTIFGATYLVLAPDHELVQKLKSQIINFGEVEKYINEVKSKTEIERTAEEKIKTGVELKGIKAINPANKEEIPVWIADYVLSTYGTGAIMAVPAHDERDFEFAKKYNLPIKYVVATPELERLFPPKEGKPFVYRKAVECYVRNPKNDQFLLLDWKVLKWKCPITGGIENGEDLISAAKREIYEETGYKNLRFIQHLGAPMRTDFYHPHKDENRRADFYGLYFELENEEKDEVQKDEISKHLPVWIQRKEVENFLNTSLIPFRRIGKQDLSYSGEGVLINSSKFNGLDSEKAKKEITKFVGGKEKTTFKLRDWVFSRQRYWGEPIPVIHCENCALRDPSGQGIVPVPEKDLPVKLPRVKNYQPTESGESPLANITKWVNVKCPKCGGKAKRETDTMPNWAGSSWYYLRYVDPKNNKEFASKKNLKYWLTSPQPSPERRGENTGGVDWYNGGNEHTTLHLLYSRFWHKFLYDLKLVPTNEPYMKRTSHGMILGEGGVKMSKSLGNVINPDDIVKTYGADTLRIYEMFMGPFDQSVAWSTESIIGSRRFIEKIWRIGEKIATQSKNTSPQPSPERRGGSFPFQGKAGDEVRRLLHKTIKKVSEDIENMRFNTAISSMMILATEMERAQYVSEKDFKMFLQILAPFAPHIGEELWSMLGEKKSINFSKWPKWDEDLMKDEEVKIVVQINGKVRTEIMIEIGGVEEDIKKKALKNAVVLKYTMGKDIKRMIYVKNRLINIVI